ncbi:MAG: hypothetical protein A4E68_01908 [Syntrophaceae bacterium PtaB.Bin095]|jgi:hypothetical protein|nr:MAG: hypothetical protein A4E68_01908 [Syntrophaceae bacterium PtaB.Bin095]
MKQGRFFEGNIRTLTAKNVKRQFNRLIRKSATGRISVSFWTKPGVALPPSADKLGTNEKGGHYLSTPVSAGEVLDGTIEMMEGYEVPLSIIDGQIFVMGKTR